MLDFRIDTFLAVCRHMNFTRAAEELNITQPGVSKHIRQLEETYGSKLFAYDGKKPRLTRAGRTLLDAALTMKHDELFLRERLAVLRDGERRLHFGATLTVGAYVMPQAIERYLARYPDAHIRMEVANTRELLRRVDGGQLDFAVVEGFFEKREYEHLAYASEPFVAVCAAEYAFRRPVRRLEDLQGERLILREKGSGTRHILEKHLELHDMTVSDFAQVMEIASIDAIKALTLAGCGVTFLYEAAVKDHLRAGALRLIELEDFHYTHDFTFLWRKNSIFPEDYHAVFAALRGEEDDSSSNSSSARV